MTVPPEYHGREQSLLKHRVLQAYVLAWGHKLASAARKRRVRLCYVDGFAGPWNAKSTNLDDTSIAISLGALEAAATAWGDAKLVIEAAFVEKDGGAYQELRRFLDNRAPGKVVTRAHHGEFGAFVPELQRWIGSDAALIFVDPTGWKGAAMKYIAPLSAGAYRDVLVNVMFDHINRFKDDEREFLRAQMREFFGLGEADLPPGLSEEELFSVYRGKLKELCGVKYAADLAIPHPTDDRTKFRLVVGGKNTAVLDVFRSIERKVIGAEAAVVREDAMTRDKEERSPQLTLLQAPASSDARYESAHARGLREARAAILVAAHVPVRFGELWPDILETHHITKSELARVGWDLYREGLLAVMNAKPRQRTLQDDSVIQRKTA